jgi:hypothetical protein
MDIAQASWENVNETHFEKNSVTLPNALDDLYKSARSFTLKNFLSVKEADEFLELSLEMLIDLIVDDDLVVDSEEDVFYAVMKWVEFDPETRGEELPNLLQSVRLEHMPIEFLNTIKEHDLITTNPLCLEVVENVLLDQGYNTPQYDKEREGNYFNEIITVFEWDFSKRFKIASHGSSSMASRLWHPLGISSFRLASRLPK